MCSSYLPLGVPNWVPSTTIKTNMPPPKYKTFEIPRGGIVIRGNKGKRGRSRDAGRRDGPPRREASCDGGSKQREQARHDDGVQRSSDKDKKSFFILLRWQRARLPPPWWETKRSSSMSSWGKPSQLPRSIARHREQEAWPLTIPAKHPPWRRRWRSSQVMQLPKRSGGSQALGHAYPPKIDCKVSNGLLPQP
jgi:hypothetical protein